MKLTAQLIGIDKNRTVPVYLQIANAIIGHIRQGLLKPRSALPSSRSLATLLDVHRKTVIAAYDELYAQSWVDVLPRRGIFVAVQLPDVTPRRIADGKEAVGGLQKAHFDIDTQKVPFPDLFIAKPDGNLVLNYGFPDTRLAPVDLLVREYRRFANYHFTSKYLSYGPEQGSENLRAELARFLGETRGLQVQPEDILITKGVQMALYLTAQILLNKKDIVIVADPGYPGANEVFEHAGAQLQLVSVDDCGMDIDAVEAICKKQKVRMVYVIPHHHSPTTVTLSPERRMRLLELAVKYRFAIVEDDYDYDFHYACSPILPLASADSSGSVVYIGSFCKTIAPGIRIGFMIAPPDLILQATRLRKLIDRQGEQLLEEAIANLLKNGDIGRHLKKANKIYHERRDHLCSLLKEQLNGYVSFKVPNGGFAVWMEYLDGINAKDVAEKAAAMGLSVGDGSEYYHDRKRISNAIRVGFASLNLKEMEAAVDLLAKAVKKAHSEAGTASG